MAPPLSLKRYPTGILSSEEPTSIKAWVKVTDWAELKSFKKEDANLTRKAGATTTGILPRAEEPSMRLPQDRADVTRNGDPGPVDLQS